MKMLILERMVSSAEHLNFMATVEKNMNNRVYFIQSKKAVQMVENQIGPPTYTNNLVTTIMRQGILDSLSLNLLC